MKISIIVPSYNEGSNVIRLAERLLPVLESAAWDFEVIFVDDSLDETPMLLRELHERDARFRCLHRERERGLATAVLAGFRIAEGDLFVVMDADLQHPPEIVPQLVRTMMEKGCDLVVPSRFVPGGDDGGLSWPRKVVSWTARTIARVALKKARGITDPTSGMFAVRREAVEQSVFNPVGWKILLEIMVRGKIETVEEIPYSFVARDLGDSKMSLKEQARYLLHIVKLVAHSEEDLRFWKFCLVGGSGVVVNTIMYATLVGMDWQVWAAFCAASFLSMVSNFALNNAFTWRHEKNDPIWTRFFKFVLVSTGGIALSSGLVYALFHWVGLHYLLSGWVGILGGMAWNFALNDLWTFARRRRRKTRADNSQSARSV
jgi:dolichol-phosphate mannosyltransferase